MTPRLDGQVVLAVFAHPDDESLACGGTLAMLADAGARVVVMCASRGERGSSSGPVRDDALAVERAAEMRDAAEALGIAEVQLFSHPDGELRWAEVTRFNAEIVLFLRRHAVAAVITFAEDGLYWHPDHIGVHERVVTAVQSLGDAAPPLYLVTMCAGAMSGIVGSAIEKGWAPPPSGFWSIVPESFGLLAAPATLVADVGDWVPRKLAAIMAHRTQMGIGHPFAQLPEADARRWLGTECFRRAAVAGRPDRVLEQVCTPVS